MSDPLWWFLLTIALTLGLSFGSFLNVVVYRLPAGLSLFYPPSRCPTCGHTLGATENVPVLGWLWLRGRCRWCKTAIASRYPLVEGLMGLLFAALFWRFGWGTEALGYGILLFWLVALALIDLDTLTLPNALTQSGLVLGLLVQTVWGWQRGETIAQLMAAIGGMVLGLWLLEIIRFLGTLWLGQPAMGGGDPKLAGLIGAWLGWKLLLVSVFFACSLGALMGVGAIALGRLQRRQAMPFGPFLALGAIATVFGGDWLLGGYQTWLRSGW